MGGVAHWPERSVERTIEKGLGSIPSSTRIFFFLFFFTDLDSLFFMVKHYTTAFISKSLEANILFFSFTYYLFILSFGYNEISIA